MSKIKQIVNAIETEDSWQLMGEKQLLIDALNEIESRLEKLENK